MSLEEAKKVLFSHGIIFDDRNRLSQVGGLKPLPDILKRGKFRSRFEASFGCYKARTLVQSIIGIWAGAKTMVEIGQTGKDPLVNRFIGNVVEEAQLARDFKSFSRKEIEVLHEFNITQTVLDLIQKIPTEETLYFDIDATSIEKYGEQEGV